MSWKQQKSQEWGLLPEFEDVNCMQPRSPGGEAVSPTDLLEVRFTSVKAAVGWRPPVLAGITTEDLDLSREVPGRSDSFWELGERGDVGVLGDLPLSDETLQDVRERNTVLRITEQFPRKTHLSVQHSYFAEWMTWTLLKRLDLWCWISQTWNKIIPVLNNMKKKKLSCPNSFLSNVQISWFTYYTCITTSKIAGKMIIPTYVRHLVKIS